MHPDGPNGDGWRRPFTAHLPPRTLLARSETTPLAGPAKLIAIDPYDAGRLLELPRRDADTGPHLGKEQIEGLLEAVSAVRLREEQELPHSRDEVGLMHGWRQVFFLQELSVAVEQSMQVVGGARHN